MEIVGYKNLLKIFKENLEFFTSLDDPFSFKGYVDALLYFDDMSDNNKAFMSAIDVLLKEWKKKELTSDEEIASLIFALKENGLLKFLEQSSLMEEIDFLPTEIWDAIKDMSDEQEQFNFVKNKLGNEFSDEDIKDFINKYKTALTEKVSFSADTFIDNLLNTKTFDDINAYADISITQEEFDEALRTKNLEFEIVKRERPHDKIDGYTYYIYTYRIEGTKYNIWVDEVGFILDGCLAY